MAISVAQAGRRLAFALWLSAAAVGISATVGCHDLNNQALTATATDTWTRSYDLAAGGEFQVVAGNGNVTVERGAGPKVEVAAERIVKAATDEIAKDVLTRVTIREEASADKVVLTTERLGGMVIGVNIEINYRVTVPSGVRVRARTSNGNVTLTNLDATGIASTENGNIGATGIARGLETRVVNGNVKATLTAFSGDTVDLRTVNGNVELTLPSDINATLVANATNGSAEVSGLPWEAAENNGTARERSNRRIRGRFNAGGPPIELNTVNGSIRVHGQ